VFCLKIEEYSQIHKLLVRTITSTTKKKCSSMCSMKILIGTVILVVNVSQDL